MDGKKLSQKLFVIFFGGFKSKIAVVCGVLLLILSLPSSLLAMLVVIDPAHGGEDFGVSAGRIIEKDVTLRMARYLRDELQHRGISVRLTRDDDRDVSIKQRRNIAAAVQADALIGLHLNSGFGKDARGFSLYLPMVAQQASAQEEQEKILADMVSTNVLNDSIMLATEIEKSLIGTLSLASRGVYHLSTPLTRNADLPTVVLEIGFISNADEEKSLINDAYQREIARAIATGIANSLQQ
ncbi:MAG: N-acetylmuramoyl-L-alanine amidase [Deltaproteobacteria bacterium]|nr:N-acetylmuramoyl-L-alanine amidase [Deltaproteobacteria bacterium]